MPAVEVVDAYLQSLPGRARRLGHSEWGLSIPADLPVSAVDERALDRLVGLVVEAAVTVRGM
jgi:hypothetical protein